MEISTRYGAAAAALDAAAARPRFLLALTHGAGGGIDTADLLAARDAGLLLGGTVARVLQPYRVRGGRVPGSAQRQDEAWLDIVGVLRGAAPGAPLVQGGRSNGARLACRTAQSAGAQAVLALAFPLHPPGRPDRSRAGELRAADTDVLVVSGDRDPFGVPAAAAGLRVMVLSGESHSLARHPERVRDAVHSWLSEVLRLSPG